VKQIQSLTLEQVRARYKQNTYVDRVQDAKASENIEITNNASDITIATTGVAQSSHTHNAAEIDGGRLATARLDSSTSDSTAF
jgi:hypothetical protein